MMICPNCRTRVSEDAVICDSCNHILDASFLGEGITNEATSTKPASGDDHRTKVKAIAPPVPTPALVSPISADLALDAEPRRSSLAGAAPPESVNQALTEIGQQYRALPNTERWATGSAVAFLVSLTLPWRWTEVDDSVIGLFTSAGPLALLALYVALIAFIRRQPVLRAFKTPLLAGGMGAALVTLVFSGLTLRGSIAKGVIHVGGKTKEVWKALPHIGLAVGLIAALVMLAASLFSYLQREKLPDA